MSDHLKAFLSAYLEWVEAGAKNGQPFSRRYGLCSNLCDWARVFARGNSSALETELGAMFRVDGLDECHPFGVENYFDARESETQHLDAKRIAWVRSKIAQFATALRSKPRPQRIAAGLSVMR